jgi:dihydroorotate dehydrogenase (NAD+) catalytic subunit
MTRTSSRHTKRDAARKQDARRTGADIRVKIGKLSLKNPLILASGTHALGCACEDLLRWQEYGAIIAKTITVKPRLGNVPPRTCEAACGLINAIGLQNEGIEAFIRNKIPALKKLRTTVIISLYGEDIRDLVTLITRCEEIPLIRGIELNLSCPNLSLKRDVFVSQDVKMLSRYVHTLKKYTSKTLIAKLSPHVASIKETVKAAQEAGADAISLVNTFKALAIDTNTLAPKLGNITGGLSGPAIKPMALEMVWEAASVARVPIIGGGGISDADDGIEFLAAGATALQIGTINFVVPEAIRAIPSRLAQFLARKKIKDIPALRARFAEAARRRH